MSWRCCAIIPSRNHTAVIGEIVRELRGHGLDVFIVDDGSNEPHRTVLAALHAPAAGITVYRLAVNRGKGAAVMKGVELATAAGFTHALQIDADGQHDLAQVPALLALGKAHPAALIAGAPVYDQTMPRSRRVGRRITHFWVGIRPFRSIRRIPCAASAFTHSIGSTPYSVRDGSVSGWSSIRKSWCG